MKRAYINVSNIKLYKMWKVQGQFEQRSLFRFHIAVKIKCVYNKLIKGKGKSVPLQAWSGPEGSRKLRFSDFMTTAQDSGKVVSLTHRPPLPPGNAPGTHFC